MESIERRALELVLRNMFDLYGDTEITYTEEFSGRVHMYNASFCVPYISHNMFNTLANLRTYEEEPTKDNPAIHIYLFGMDLGAPKIEVNIQFLFEVVE